MKSSGSEITGDITVPQSVNQGPGGKRKTDSWSGTDRRLPALCDYCEAALEVIINDI